MSSYQERTYRHRVRATGLTCFRVVVKQTDLWVCAERDLKGETTDLVFDARHQIEQYMDAHPGFSTALSPVDQDPLAPAVVKEMIQASAKVHVGPMAAVAGVIAQYVGTALLSVSDQVIVENGGGCFHEGPSAPDGLCICRAVCLE